MCITYITKKKNTDKESIESKEKQISYLNDNKENIILSISGGYSSQLDVINCRYINMNDYFGNILGYFELRIKMKNEKFKNNINSKIDTYKDSDKILIRACLLPVACFNEIIKFCM